MPPTGGPLQSLLERNVLPLLGRVGRSIPCPRARQFLRVLLLRLLREPPLLLLPLRALLGMEIRSGLGRAASPEARHPGLQAVRRQREEEDQNPIPPLRRPVVEPLLPEVDPGNAILVELGSPRRYSRCDCRRRGLDFGQPPLTLLRRRAQLTLILL